MGSAVLYEGTWDGMGRGTGKILKADYKYLRDAELKKVQNSAVLYANKVHSDL